MTEIPVSICVITATTGHRHLKRCLRSVQQQTLSSVSHYVVIDGPEHSEKVNQALAETSGGPKRVHVLQLPEATGKDDWICHRIYGAMPFLVNSQWVCFLDDDNWYDDDHLSSLLDAVVAKNASWGFALRKIFDSEGNFGTLDQCESLGTLHPVFHHPITRLVDTNCYLLRRDVAISYCSIWNRPRTPKGMLKPDIELVLALMSHNLPAASNLRHSVNYTLRQGPDEISVESFEEGNAIMRKRYPAGLPWVTGAPANVVVKTTEAPGVTWRF